MNFLSNIDVISYRLCKINNLDLIYCVFFAIFENLKNMKMPILGTVNFLWARGAHIRNRTKLIVSYMGTLRTIHYINNMGTMLIQGTLIWWPYQEHKGQPLSSLTAA